MTERPIIFSAPMVREILAGTKTQTRRVVKFKPWHQIEERDDGSPWPWMYDDDRASDHWVPCPYGQPGDRLWVKEQTIKVEDQGWIGPIYTESDAGRQSLEWGYGEYDDPDHIPPHAIKRRPSLFMTRAMSRITLEILGVRVERLQDISEKDAEAEGASEAPMHMATMYSQAAVLRSRYREGFEDLWESLHGPGSWDANPWVWVIEFKRLNQTGNT